MTLVLMPIIISLTSFPSIYFFKYIVVNPYTLYFVLKPIPFSVWYTKINIQLEINS